MGTTIEEGLPFNDTRRAPAGIPQACSSASAGDSYETAVRRIWRPAEVATGDSLAIRHELVRHATLAPSSHNTQCWRFRVEQTAITILPDLTRRTPIVDPDDHHLYVSLGCATENLVQAALAHGLKALPQSNVGEVTEIRVELEPTRALASPLFAAIPTRQSTRAEYDGKPVSAEELKLLERAGTSQGVRMILLTEKAALEKVLEYVVAGNSAQLKDPAFIAELKQWIRFGSAEAVRYGDGLYSAASGNPSVPRWLGSMLFGMLFTANAENRKYAKAIRSSAGVAVFISQKHGGLRGPRTGSRSDAAMNALPCKPPLWGFATLSSISRWRSRLCDRNSQHTWMSVTAARIWWCASVADPKCRSRFGGHWRPYWCESAVTMRPTSLDRVQPSRPGGVEHWQRHQ
jgi:nitroreductase